MFSDQSLLTYKNEDSFLHYDNLNRQWWPSLKFCVPQPLLDFEGRGLWTWGQAVTPQHTQCCPWQEFVVDITKNQASPLPYTWLLLGLKSIGPISGRVNHFLLCQNAEEWTYPPGWSFSAPISCFVLCPLPFSALLLAAESWALQMLSAGFPVGFQWSSAN